MGYFVGKINSADDKYEMWLSIDDLIFDGVKPKKLTALCLIKFNQSL